MDEPVGSRGLEGAGVSCRKTQTADGLTANTGKLASYELADVFTTTLFGGNQLALFADASDIPDPMLQKIARELNLSETAFAYPLGKAEWKLRIFTPTMEHPFAGHPTIGSALLLSERDNLDHLVLHEAVGPVEITVERAPGRPAIARLNVPSAPEERDVQLHEADIAAMLSLSPADIEQSARKPRMMSCGVPFLFVHVSTGDALARARLKRDLWSKLIGGGWAPHVYLFASDSQLPGEIHARMFAPAMGIDEDPATGGAAAALAGVLAAEQPEYAGRREWNIAQGVEMGRPSLIQLSATLNAGQARDIKVGGSAVRTGRGLLDLAALKG